jgi:hypothetical protein
VIAVETRARRNLTGVNVAVLVSGPKTDDAVFVVSGVDNRLNQFVPSWLPCN